MIYHNDSTFLKLKEMCEKICPPNVVEHIYSLYFKLKEYTNCNWNIIPNSDFFIEFILSCNGKELSFSYCDEIKKYIWFTQEGSRCISGYSFDDPTLLKLFEWIKK